jgi:hypothetical protein
MARPSLIAPWTDSATPTQNLSYNERDRLHCRCLFHRLSHSATLRRDFPKRSPRAGEVAGRNEIRASWENFAKISSNGRVELRDQRICIDEDLAYETGTEHVNVLIAKDQVQSSLRVSNVYRREGSDWRMVHHHVDSDPTVREALSKL